MSIKPENIIKWALNAAAEIRQGGTNKLAPTEALENNGSLDGNLSVNHFNWMMNNIGLWTVFLNDMVVLSDGDGVGLSKDDHFSLIVAADKTDLAKNIIGLAYKNGASAASVQIIQNATLDFGTPNINGTVSITGATYSNIIAFSLNFKK